MEVCSGHGFLGEHPATRALSKRFYEVSYRLHDVPADAGLGQHLASDGGVPAVGSEDQRSFGEIPAHLAGASSKSVPWSINSGTPRSTPWKPMSGSPSVMPRASIRYSRIVSSCALVRFLMTDIARRTRPRASK